MRIIGDLHIHSRFSRATSKRMNIAEIARFADIKGLNLVGTGDITHPKWLKELRKDLVEVLDAGLYKPKKAVGSINFMLTGEVNTIFTSKGKTKKIHHLIFTPSFDLATQIIDRLRKYGAPDLDGRPTLKMTGAQLVEEVMTISPKNEVVPAHVWTPWFSLFGAFSGFDRIEDCYQDMTEHIHALETGLSSNPPMNWRVSALDRFTLLSNSDSHSYWPWRIGREANVFDLEQVTYEEVLDIIRKKDTARFAFTIETDPAYGKYYWSGHRNCKVSMSLQEARRFDGYCPVCRRKLTKGVEQRVEELADRPINLKPESVIGYITLLPLSEIIAKVLDVSSPNVQSVWGIYNNLTAKFGNEFTVLIDAPMAEMLKVVDRQIAEAIVRVRESKVQVIPGYDGVYGRPILSEADKVERARLGRVPQRNLTEWSAHT